jgi:hypothetical protein
MHLIDLEKARDLDSLRKHVRHEEASPETPCGLHRHEVLARPSREERGELIHRKRCGVVLEAEHPVDQAE